MEREGYAASDKEAALKSLMESGPGRDYFLKVSDVQNIAASLQTAWKRHRDQQKSVELYIQDMGTDVLLHQRMAPLPGTSDAAMLAAQKQPTAAADISECISRAASGNEASTTSRCVHMIS
jgi:hypothetical protein